MSDLAPVDPVALRYLLAPYGLEVSVVPDDAPIPGSYWGDPEAGLRGRTLFVRADTPLHSALHESAHFICMSDDRRAALDRDAGGEPDEESAVCYLQLLLAAELPRIGRARLSNDMDAWGYSFRLGSTQRWFEEDAADARAWLVQHGIIDASGRLQRRLARSSSQLSSSTL
jgi:hypothetical protein